jgi:cobalt-zinc-cadmium efflux system outer membrane protein
VDTTFSGFEPRCARDLPIFVLIVCALMALPSDAHPQLTLTAAQGAARQASPELRAAREAIAAAAGRERQAGAFANPTVAYGREQTSRTGQTNSQNIAQLEQALEVGGQRGARRDAARLRRASAEARLAWATSQLDFDVARAFARAIAADRRAQIAEQAVGSLTDAQRVSERRLAAGDVAGYVVRRVQLETARFAALRAAAALERRSTRVALASLIGVSSEAIDSLALPTDIEAPPPDAPAPPSFDSLLIMSERARSDVRAAMLEAEAVAAESRLVARERVPTPTFSLGYKGEHVADTVRGSSVRYGGFVAGLSVPLPLFDRRGGAVEATTAEARRALAETAVIRRRVAREVTDALDALRAAETQRAALAPHLGEGARIALRAVQTSYTEGEITLAEWLDAVRAYQDAESTYVTLQAEVAVARAALARAIGGPLTTTSSLQR